MPPSSSPVTHPLFLDQSKTDGMARRHVPHSCRGPPRTAKGSKRAGALALVHASSACEAPVPWKSWQMPCTTAYTTGWESSSRASRSRHASHSICRERHIEGDSARLPLGPSSQPSGCQRSQWDAGWDGGEANVRRNLRRHCPERCPRRCGRPQPMQRSCPLAEGTTKRNESNAGSIANQTRQSALWTGTLAAAMATRAAPCIGPTSLGCVRHTLRSRAPLPHRSWRGGNGAVGSCQ